MTTGSTEQQVFGVMTVRVTADTAGWRSNEAGFCRCPACKGCAFSRAYVKLADTCSGLWQEQPSPGGTTCRPISISWWSAISSSLASQAEMRYVWPMWAHFAVWAPLTLILAPLFLQPIKGAVIGLQWAFTCMAQR